MLDSSLVYRQYNAAATSSLTNVGEDSAWERISVNSKVLRSAIVILKIDGDLARIAHLSFCIVTTLLFFIQCKGILAVARGFGKYNATNIFPTLWRKCRASDDDRVFTV